MAYSKKPSYLWHHRTGVWYLKLPIPGDLRHHYTDDETKRTPTHITRSLGTHNRREADRLKHPLLAEYHREFDRLRAGSAPSSILRDVMDVRGLIRRLHAEGDLEAVAGMEDSAADLAEALEEKQGLAKAQQAYKLMTRTDTKTIKEALADLEAASADKKKQTRQSYRMAVRELLEAIKVEDCLPEAVTDKAADAFVEALNDGPLSVSAKSARVGALATLWKHMARKGWPPSPWIGHKLTAPAKPLTDKQGSEADEGENVRPFTDAEVIHVMAMPEPSDKRARAYTRALFREMYAMGFITGMRLNEIASLRMVDVEDLGADGLVLTVPKGVAKTEAGIRRIPVIHPVALAILRPRMKGKDATSKARLFHECKPGGADNKPSWYVGKAMSNERLKRLALPREVNFHSTRRSFVTLMENKSAGDPIAQQRYIGHDVPSLMHRTYSGGTGVAKLRTVVEGLRYSPEVEAALLLAVRPGVDAA